MRLTSELPLNTIMATAYYEWSPFVSNMQYKNIVLLLVWRFIGGKNVIVNAVENGAQTFNEVKDIR